MKNENRSPRASRKVSNRQGKPNRRSSWEDRESKDMRKDFEKDYDRFEKKKERDGKLSSLNDFSWYNKYPELINSAASIPFPYRPGRVIDMGSTKVGTQTYNVQMAIPGVMSLAWLPSVGYSDSVTSPISIAAKELYAKVRSAFSGSLDADAPDFMIYLLALDSIYSYIGYLKRIYGVVSLYDPNNYTIPYGLLYSMGFDTAMIENLVANKTKFFNLINQLIHMTDKFKMPNIMDIFARHYWMSANVYSDADTLASQFYVFNQAGWYQFAMLNVPSSTTVKAGGLQMIQNPIWTAAAATTPDTDAVSFLYDYGVSLISALAESDDGYTISGYLMRAFQDVPSFTVDLLPIDYVCPISYVPEVLAQIENSTAIWKSDTIVSGTTLHGMNITQDPSTNTLYHTPQTQGSITHNSAALTVLPPMVSIRSDAPSVEEVVVATRLKAYIGESEDNYLPIIAGTEIPLLWTVWSPNTLNSDVNADVNGWHSHVYPMYVSAFPLLTDSISNNSNSVLSVLQGAIEAEQFDWHPIGWLHVAEYTALTPNTPANAHYDYKPMGDVHNLTVMGINQLQEIHRMCVLSEFNAFNA